MPDTDGLTADQNQRDDYAHAVATVLVVAAALLVVSGLFYAGSLTGVSARDRFEFVSERSAEVLTSLLLIVAVAVLFFTTRTLTAQARRILVAVILIGALVVLLDAFSILDLLTRHYPSLSDTADITFTETGSLAARLSGALPMAASMLIALVAMVGANRLGNLVNGSRGTSELPPG